MNKTILTKPITLKDFANCEKIVIVTDTGLTKDKSVNKREEIFEFGGLIDPSKNITYKNILYRNGNTTSRLANGKWEVYMEFHSGDGKPWSGFKKAYLDKINDAISTPVIIDKYGMTAPQFITVTCYTKPSTLKGKNTKITTRNSIKRLEHSVRKMF